MRNILVASALILVSQASFSASKNFNIKFGANSGGFGFGPAIEYKVNKNMTVGLLRESRSFSAGGISVDSTGMGFNARYYFKEALKEDSYIHDPEKAIKEGSYIHASYVTGTIEGNDSSLISFSNTFSLLNLAPLALMLLV
jgi:hypothetical protein